MCYEVLGTYEEPGTLTQGAPVFPGSSRLGIEPKTPGWLVQGRTTSPVTQLRLGEVTVGGVRLLLMCVTAGPSAAVTCAGRVSEAAACQFFEFSNLHPIFVSVENSQEGCEAHLRSTRLDASQLLCSQI